MKPNICAFSSTNCERKLSRTSAIRATYIPNPGLDIASSLPQRRSARIALKNEGANPRHSMDRMSCTQFQIEVENVYPRLAEKSELSLQRVLPHDGPHV